MCWMVEVEVGLEAGPEADLEAVGAQQEGLQPLEGPVEGPVEGPRKASWAERRSRKRRITMKPMMELVLNL